MSEDNEVFKKCQDAWNEPRHENPAQLTFLFIKAPSYLFLFFLKLEVH